MAPHPGVGWRLWLGLAAVALVTVGEGSGVAHERHDGTWTITVLNAALASNWAVLAAELATFAGGGGSNNGDGEDASTARTRESAAELAQQARRWSTRPPGAVDHQRSAVFDYRLASVMLDGVEDGSLPQGRATVEAAGLLFDVASARSGNMKLRLTGDPSFTGRDVEALRRRLWAEHGRARRSLSPFDGLHQCFTGQPAPVPGPKTEHHAGRKPTATKAQAPFAQSHKVEVRKQLDLDEFRRGFVSRGRPVVVDDYASRVLRSPWSWTFMLHACNGTQWPLTHTARPHELWKHDQVTLGAEKVPLDAFVGAVHAQSGGAILDWSLHQVPLLRSCPNLLADVAVPKYMAQDLLQRLPLSLGPAALPHLAGAARAWAEDGAATPRTLRDHSPALSAAPKGARSGLRRGAFGAHTLVLALEGRSRWMLFGESDLPTLQRLERLEREATPPVGPDGSDVGTGGQTKTKTKKGKGKMKGGGGKKGKDHAPPPTPAPKFGEAASVVVGAHGSVDRGSPARDQRAGGSWRHDWHTTCPDLNAVTAQLASPPQVVMLQPGDLLFVPAGMPHQVLSMDNTLSLHFNFADESNAERVRTALRKDGAPGNRQLANFLLPNATRAEPLSQPQRLLLAEPCDLALIDGFKSNAWNRHLRRFGWTWPHSVVGWRSPDACG